MIAASFSQMDLYSSAVWCIPNTISRMKVSISA
ncbi:hypothetical protein A6R68_18043 [Neotoma lepida]|uniref:Uncharacterized protein n=1 Tax=Neotoma lepida TaxID=56216 RepID=A0A1A6HC66_NEOLE|nr:hypothetical protein A6R68_18043 [Neotoma lepida]